MNSIQDKLLRSVKDERSRIRRDTELRVYESAWEGHFKKKWNRSDAASLRRAINSSDLVILGDFHGYDQSQRTHLRLLRSIARDTTRVGANVSSDVCIVMECFRPEDDKLLKQWIEGKLSDAKLLRATNWVKNWGFSWHNYRPILEYAKQRGWQVVGLTDLEGKLKDRDKRAAKRCEDLRLKFEKLILIYGDFHLGPRGIVKWLKGKNATGSFKKPLLIHQNSQALYLRSRERLQLGMVDVYSLGDSEFCIINSAPWVKWTSHLAFAGSEEQSLDDEPFIDVIVSLGKNWAKLLNVDWDWSEWDFHTWNGRSRLLKKLKNNDFLRNLARKEIGFVDPVLRIIYLPRPSLNLGSHLIAQAIWFSMGITKNLGLDQLSFSGLLHLEMFGFCFSKCFNPYRPPRTFTDLARETVSDPLAREGYAVCSRFASQPTKVLVRTGLKSGEVYAARRLGSFLGEIWWRKRSVEDRLEGNVLRFFKDGCALPMWESKWNKFVLGLWKKSHKVHLESKGERL